MQRHPPPIQAVAGRVGLQSVANADHETKKQNMQHEVRGSSRGATGVCHSSAGMARMKRQAESLGRAISDVQNHMLHADNNHERATLKLQSAGCPHDEVQLGSCCSRARTCHVSLSQAAMKTRATLFKPMPVLGPPLLQDCQS